MKRFNLSAWAVDHPALMMFLIAMFGLAGVLSYQSLGRAEDPSFTIKVVIVFGDCWDSASFREEQGEELGAHSRNGVRFQFVLVGVPDRVLVRAGTLFRWRFLGAAQHDVTLANGPVGFSSPSVSSGTFAHRFARRGVYHLFCSLHPTRMTQTVIVR